MNISPLTVKDLRMLGWNIVRIPEIMDSKSKDIYILTYARDHNKVVITQDLDFSSLLALGDMRNRALLISVSRMPNLTS
jgi:predicted nuclease of predicted toxin-antitoxin system